MKNGAGNRSVNFFDIFLNLLLTFQKVGATIIPEVKK